MEETVEIGDKTIKVDAEIDCFGLLCPMPIVKTAAKVKELQVGQVLKVASTDLGIKEDMPVWCAETGNEFLGVKETDGEYFVYLRRLV